jgi:PadR family transcriptional regulator, regulatory protein AphA
MAPSRRLSPTSYIVLGLLDLAPGTPYDLKIRVANSLGNFWSVQHAQLYTETARLGEEGLLSETRETEGRRRKTYAITKAGKRVLEGWLATSAEGMIAEHREPGLLKLFFGADPATIAPEQLEGHRAKLAEYEALAAVMKQGAGDFPAGMVLTLEAGLGYERESVRFWSSLL